jgi:hypothetical protein
MDEWFEMTIADIRAYEVETAHILAEIAAGRMKPGQSISSPSDQKGSNDSSEDCPKDWDELKEIDSLLNLCKVFLPQLQNTLSSSSTSSSLSSSSPTLSASEVSAFAFNPTSQTRSLNSWHSQTDRLLAYQSKLTSSASAPAVSLASSIQHTISQLMPVTRRILQKFPHCDSGFIKKASSTSSTEDGVKYFSPKFPERFSSSFIEDPNDHHAYSILNLSCHHAASSVSIPSVQIPSLLSLLYFEVEEASSSGSPLLSSAQSKFLWKCLPKPQISSSSASTCASPENKSSNHVPKASSTKDFPKPQPSPSFFSQLFGNEVLSQELQLSSLNLADQNSADSFATAWSPSASGLNNTVVEDEVDNQAEMNELEAPDLEDLWRWHPLLMQSLRQPVIHLPMYVPPPLPYFSLNSKLHIFLICYFQHVKLAFFHCNAPQKVLGISSVVRELFISCRHESPNYSRLSSLGSPVFHRIN